MPRLFRKWRDPVSVRKEPDFAILRGVDQGMGTAEVLPPLVVERFSWQPVTEDAQGGMA